MTTRLKTFATFIALLTLLVQTEVRAEMDINHRFSTTVPCNSLIVGIDNTCLPLISVRINGSTTATFLVDTGTNGLAVTNGFAKKLKLTQDKRNQAGYPDTLNSQTVHTTTLMKMEIGKIVLNNTSLLVLPPGRLAGLEKSIDGILGSNFLSEVALVWKPAQHEMTFLAPGNLAASELLPLGFNPTTVVPLTSTSNGLWTVQASFANLLRNTTDTLVVDTGSATTSVSLLQSHTLDLKPTATDVLKWGFNGTEKISTAPVGRLTIGSASLYNFPLDYSKEITSLTPPALGVNVLSQFAVLMDFPGKKMYLQPNPTATPAIIIGPAPATAKTPVK